MKATRGLLARASSLTNVVAPPKKTAKERGENRSSVSGSGVLKAVLAVARKDHAKKSLSSSSVATKSTAPEEPRIGDISTLLGELGIGAPPVSLPEPSGHARDEDGLSKTVHTTAPEPSPSGLPRKHRSTGSYESKKKKKKSPMRRVHSAEGVERSPKKESHSSPKREGRKTSKSSHHESGRRKTKKSSNENKPGQEREVEKKKKSNARRESRMIRKTSSLAKMEESMDLSQLSNLGSAKASKPRRTNSLTDLPLQGSIMASDASVCTESTSKLHQRVGRSLRKTNSLPEEAIGNHQHKRRHHKGTASEGNGMDGRATKREGRRNRKSTTATDKDQQLMNASAISGMDGSAKRESRRRRTSSTSEAVFGINGEMDSSYTRRSSTASSVIQRSPIRTRTRRTKSVEGRRQSSPVSSISPLRSPRGVADTNSCSLELPPAPDLEAEEEPHTAVLSLAERRQRRKDRASSSSELHPSHQHRGMDSRSAIRQKQLQQRLKNAHIHALPTTKDQNANKPRGKAMMDLGEQSLQMNGTFWDSDPFSSGDLNDALDSPFADLDDQEAFEKSMNGLSLKDNNEDGESWAFWNSDPHVDHSY